MQKILWGPNIFLHGPAGINRSAQSTGQPTAATTVHALLGPTNPKGPTPPRSSPAKPNEIQSLIWWGSLARLARAPHVTEAWPDRKRAASTRSIARVPPGRDPRCAKLQQHEGEVARRCRSPPKPSARTATPVRVVGLVGAAAWPVNSATVHVRLRARCAAPAGKSIVVSCTLARTVAPTKLCGVVWCVCLPACLRT